MNFHVIFVHFPIALLIVYSLFEIISFGSLAKSINWFYIKAAFLITGVLSAFPTLSTGEILEHLPKYDHQLLELHSGFASASTNFYTVIAVVYILALVYKIEKIQLALAKLKLPQELNKVINWLATLGYRIVNSHILVLTSIIGMTLLTITGGLGGILTSGVGVDPVADFIYHLFF